MQTRTTFIDENSKTKLFQDQVHIDSVVQILAANEEQEQQK